MSTCSQAVLLTTGDKAAVVGTYAVIAGGGGGYSAGGGAGGFLSNIYNFKLGQTYTVTVGAGGSEGNNGANSIISEPLETVALAYGGGYGAGLYGINGGNGGSGGGGVGENLPLNVNNTPSPSASGYGGSNVAGQGNQGGFGPGQTCTRYISGGRCTAKTGGGSGGGGGAGTAGQDVTGIGGTGISYLDGFGSGATGGSGGGANGTTNTGNGGGTAYDGYNVSLRRLGGSGIVVIRTLSSAIIASATSGSPEISVANGYRYYKFTGSGSITF